MTITFFELLKPVIIEEIDFISNQLNISIDEVYQLILYEAERNQEEWFSDRVPNLNYEDPACRLAYLYIVAANASTFQHVIESDIDLLNYVLGIAREDRELKICAFGAGPGTELMAMAKFFERQNLGFSVSVDFQLLDKVKEWASSWYGIRDQVNKFFRNLYSNDRSKWPIIPSGNLLPCDVTDLDQLLNLGSVWGKNNIYVLNFLLSEIFNDDPGLRSFLSQVVRFAPTGARFIFIERRGLMWEQRIKNIATESGLILSSFIESRDRLVGEDPRNLGQIYDAIQESRKPRLTWNVVYSIGVKQ